MYREFLNPLISGDYSPCAPVYDNKRILKTATRAHLLNLGDFQIPLLRILHVSQSTVQVFGISLLELLEREYG
jgi:hypothetical protein